MIDRSRNLDTFFSLLISRYNWSPAIIAEEVKVAQASSGAEYIPMIWGEKDFDSSRLANLKALGKSSHLLGFNEPNFGSQVKAQTRRRQISAFLSLWWQVL